MGRVESLGSAVHRSLDRIFPETNQLQRHETRRRGKHRRVETTNLFLLYAMTGRIIVPKRAFPSHEAFDDFRRLIQEWADGLSVGFPVITW